ncbi:MULTISPECIES: DUF5684 domain-containing protein [unclassified Microbacterium]|uniref:DUF5684 domain-containing protein n=1 Tax=unclassified Microbacterium TaxID=2609290 RepID=UPI003744B6F9
MQTLSRITDQADFTALNSVSGLFGLVVYIVIVVALWRVFEKAGFAGWLAIIPIVNVFFLVKIAGFSGWYTLLYLIPIVNIVFHIIVSLRTGKAFGHGAVFSIVLLWIFAAIGYLIIGFGSDRYDKARIPA